MKKYMMIIAGITAALVLSGCGETQSTETTRNNVEVEHIEVEHIETEHILVEETQTERVYIDDEYTNEVDYNSRVNTWENSTTYWD